MATGQFNFYSVSLMLDYVNRFILDDFTLTEVIDGMKSKREIDFFLLVASEIWKTYSLEITGNIDSCLD